MTATTATEQLAPVLASLRALGLTADLTESPGAGECIVVDTPNDSPRYSVWVVPPSVMIDLADRDAWSVQKFDNEDGPDLVKEVTLAPGTGTLRVVSEALCLAVTNPM